MEPTTHSYADSNPEFFDLPVGLDLTGNRVESDSMGEIEVPANRYWGAQTQRSLIHFNIGGERMPIAIYHAYGYVKLAATIVNTDCDRLPIWKGKLIQRVCREIIDGQLDEHFPLYVWQTGSGTQSNMNVNEVIANRCVQLVGGKLGSKTPIHPNDDVNMSQSSNDTFPTAMHLAAYHNTQTSLLPALRKLRDSIAVKADRWNQVVKIGRTHLQDATPVTVGQEWSGYAGALDAAIAEVEHGCSGLLELAMGGTAVGTGLNAPLGFAADCAAAISKLTGYQFRPATNPFAAQGTLDPMVRAHAAVKCAAVTLFKIANDLRWLGSGPRAGLHELRLPANEPGSSIMPGKVNPTQAEAMLMVCLQVIGNDLAVSLGGAEGNFELNTFRPLLISNYLRSTTILADCSERFREYLVDGIELDRKRIDQYVADSVMLVTALSPVIGYDRAARIAHTAMDQDLTLRQAAIAAGVSAEVFDTVINPLALTYPGVAEAR